MFSVVFLFSAPGGSIITDGDPDKPHRTDKCIFADKNDIATIKAYYDVSIKHVSG